MLRCAVLLVLLTSVGQLADVFRHIVTFFVLLKDKLCMKQNYLSQCFV